MPFTQTPLKTGSAPQSLAATLIENWPEAVVVISDTGRLLFCNPTTERLLGWTGVSVLDYPLHDLVCCEHASGAHLPADCPLSAAPGANDETPNDTVWTREDGVGIHVSYRRVPLRMRDSVDAWALLVKELDLEKLSSAEYQSVISFADNNPAPIVELDASATILYSNPAMMDLLLLHGYDDAGTPTVLPSELPALINNCINCKMSLSDIESHADEYAYLWHFHYEENRAVIQAYGADVTSLKRAQLSLEKAKAAAEQASVAKSAFLANMSHEIRTPMNGVLGMLELLSGTSLTCTQQEHLRTARNSADALLTVINDILDFSKIEAGKLRIEAIDFNLIELLNEVIQLLQERAREKGLTLARDWPDELPNAIRADPTRLRQVLFNLVGNAIKFTLTGSVTLQVRIVGAKQSMLRFAIIDTGIGISPEAQSRLFRSFQQADESTTRKFGGTGLGLAISKQLTELMGGGIGIDSVPEQGSTFWFTVPLVRAAALQQTQVQAQENRTSYQARILLVEDNRVNQLVAVGMLGKFGLKPDIANNGLEAVAAVERNDYDLVFMDCQMPELDGYMATQRIRALGLGSVRPLPIVAMTANAMEADRERCTVAGMDDYLSKPVSMNTLGQMLQKWLTEKATTSLDAASANHEPQVDPALTKQG
jgi:two-component system, sensor histidine kinase